MNFHSERLLERFLRDVQIEGISRRLEQPTECTELFTMRWRVA